MTKLFYLLIKSTIQWKINDQKTTHYPFLLPTFGNVNLINPLHYSEILTSEWKWTWNISGQTNEGNILLNTSFLLFDFGTTNIDHTNSAQVLSEIYDVFQKIRWVNSNGRLPRFPKSYAFFSSNDFQLKKKYSEYLFKTGALGMQSPFGMYGTSNAITPQDFTTNHSIPNPPDADLVLIEAFDSFCEGDYELAILKAAKAVETNGMYFCTNINQGLVNTALEKFKRHTKDTINTLYHTVPNSTVNYNRSLLVENQTLYDELIKLYKARNCYVHTFHFNNTSGYTFDFQSAKKAIQTAKDAFIWTGNQKDFLFDLLNHPGIQLKFLHKIRKPLFGC